MSKKWLASLLLILILSLAACQEQEDDPTATAPAAAVVAATVEPTVAEVATATASGVVVNEILVGIAGNNNFEYIELYNASGAAIDLDGWTLEYALPGEAATAVYHWSRRTDVPAFGYYLLTRAEQEVTPHGDAIFDTSLFRRGGLVLRDAAGAPVDIVGWGEVDEGYYQGTALDALANGQVLNRKADDEGTGRLDSGDNSQDWVVGDTQTPQNSGAVLATAAPLTIALTLPETAAPGAAFTIDVAVTNDGDDALTNVTVFIPVAAELTVAEPPAGARQEDGGVQWTISELPAGETATATIGLTSPLTYFSFIINGYYAEAAGQRAYGPITSLAIAGGNLPIITARTLIGERVTVEGVVTMYPEGFFAGSGTKFYIQDETAGIQVYCPGGQNDVPIQIGDRVRVNGDVELYRTSVELIPCPDLSDIEILATDGEEPAPTFVALADAAGDESLLGGLYRVEGTVTRIEEFSFSYELDLVDEAGNTLLVYIDKLTDITVDTLDEGQQLSVTGILEIYDGTFELLPRLQSDLTTVQPPELLLEINTPQTVLPGESFEVTLTVYNYTAAPLTNIVVTLDTPEGDFDAAAFSANEARWNLDTLPANGGSVTLSRSIAVNADAAGVITLPGATATADEWPDPAAAAAAHVIVGDHLPVWAIQGAGDSSPYVRQTATTEGVVIGVFADLGGFWLQTEGETETGGADGDPATSEGIFVLLDGAEVAVAVGDRLRLTGQIRELSEQTTLAVTDAAAVTVLESGADLPAAVELNPPADAAAAEVYYEALEGMLVQVSSPALVVGPSSRFGEYALVRADSGADRVYHGGDTGYLIFVDDGSTAAFDYVDEMPYAVVSGDRVDDLAGPLAFTFGHYKIEPLAAPTITAGSRALPAPLSLPEGSFSIATYNMENLFDTELPHPDSPPRPDDEEYAWRLQKTAAVITLMGAPTVIAVQEVENIGVLEDLIATPALADYAYEAVLLEGDDSRGIDVGYLVRTDQAAVVDVAARPGPEGITSRHPLILTLDVGGQTVYIINNHFTSMSGGEAATEPRRTAQAAWNATLVEEILAQDPDAFIAVVGDLNSFYDSLPLDTLRDAGLHHVYEGFESPDLYSYIFEGESETLDHILVTANLHDLQLSTHAIHANADFSLPDPADDSARRASDHDPIVAVFQFPYTGLGGKLPPSHSLSCMGLAANCRQPRT